LERLLLLPLESTKGLMFSAKVLFLSYDGILLKLLPNPTTAVLNANCFEFLVESRNASDDF
jgi:trehalose-6-phosphatase